MSIFQQLEKFVRDVFKTSLEIFFNALKMSPNAQGYVSGSITELILKNKIEELNFEVKRIREKWEGQKHPNHHGDFYFRRDQGSWFVLESKGLKSNSEKWHKLYNLKSLTKFLYDNHDKINWIDMTKEIEPQIKEWIHENLPKFEKEYKDPLYDYEEIQKYYRNSPKRPTEKSRIIDDLSIYNREEIQTMIEDRLNYVMCKVKVLESHFVSGTSGSSARTQATPRKDEFNIISVDIFLRYTEHKFLFANPKQLESSGDDANHLQQNYIIGFIFTNSENLLELNLTNEWYENFTEVFETLNEEDSVNESEMQVDNRNVVNSMN